MKEFSRFIRRAQMKVRRRYYGEFKVQLQRPLHKYGTSYGGWTIDPTGLNENSVVYSFGVGEDISFDLSLIQSFGCTIYAFDPSPKSIVWIGKQDLPPQFHFYDFGIAAYDGQAIFNPPTNSEHVSYTVLARPETENDGIRAPVYQLQTIMNRLKHRRLDLLKMDVEGAEYDVLGQIDYGQTTIDQILIEFHHRFDSVGWQPTKATINMLKKNGYKTVYVSPSGEEFSFVRTNL